MQCRVLELEQKKHLAYFVQSTPNTDGQRRRRTKIAHYSGPGYPSLLCIPIERRRLRGGGGCVGGGEGIIIRKNKFSIFLSSTNDKSEINTEPETK